MSALDSSLNRINICRRRFVWRPQLHSFTVHNICGSKGNYLCVDDDKRNGHRRWSSAVLESTLIELYRVWSMLCMAPMITTLEFFKFERSRNCSRVAAKWTDEGTLRPGFGCSQLVDWSFVIMAPMHWPWETKKCPSHWSGASPDNIVQQHHCWFLSPSSSFE